MMSIKTVNALSHYTDWTIGHVHSGALGWVAMITIGAMYFLIPRLFGREIYKLRWVELHFWIATIGIVLYIASMWISGILQGLMWRAVNPDGTLTYSFVESVAAMVARLKLAGYIESTPDRRLAPTSRFFARALAESPVSNADFDRSAITRLKLSRTRSAVAWSISAM